MILFVERTAILQLICDSIIRQFAGGCSEWPLKAVPGISYEQLINSFCGYYDEFGLFFADA